MGAPRVVELRKAGAVCGVLREGAGTFQTAARSALPAPVLGIASYVSQDPYSEAAVSAALVAAEDFEAALRALRAAGFSVGGPDR